MGSGVTLPQDTDAGREVDASAERDRAWLVQAAMAARSKQSR